MLWEREFCNLLVDYASKIEADQLKPQVSFKDCLLAEAHVVVDILGSLFKESLLLGRLQFAPVLVLAQKLEEGESKKGKERSRLVKMFQFFNFLESMKVSKELIQCIKRIPHVFFYAHKFFLKDIFKCGEHEIDYLLLANVVYRYNALSLKRKADASFWAKLYQEIKTSFEKTKDVRETAYSVLDRLSENENIKGIILFVTYMNQWKRVIENNKNFYSEIEVPFDDKILITYEDESEEDDEKNNLPNWFTTLSYNGEHLFSKLFVESLLKNLTEQEKILVQKILDDELTEEELNRLRYSYVYKDFRTKVARFLNREDKVSKIFDLLIK